MTSVVRKTKSALFSACGGALIGATAYAASNPGKLGSIELPLWFLAVVLLVLPVGVLVAGGLRVALNRLLWSYWFVVCAIGPAVVLASTYLFGWYMSELQPTVNWSQGWWLLSATAGSTLIIEAWLPLPRYKRAKV